MRARLLLTRLGLVAMAGAAISAAGCYAYRPVGVAPATGSRVRIVLASATSITAVVAGREDARRAYSGILEASGSIAAAAGDTIALRLGELRTASGAVPDVSGQVAMVPTTQIARIEQRRFQAGTTLLAGAGFAMLALGTFIVLITATLVRGI